MAIRENPILPYKDGRERLYCAILCSKMFRPEEIFWNDYHSIERAGKIMEEVRIMEGISKLM